MQADNTNQYKNSFECGKVLRKFLCNFQNSSFYLIFNFLISIDDHQANYFLFTYVISISHVIYY